MTYPSRPSFQEQVDRVVDLAVAEGAGVRRFRDAVEPLRPLAETAVASSPERLPFLLVVTSDWLRPEVALPLVEHRGRPGRVDMNPVTSSVFRPIEGIELPGSPAYLLLDVDPGADLRDVTPADALVEIGRRGRTPLTIDEGVSLLVQEPAVLAERTAYSLLASRNPGTQQVPAVWLSARAPRLGWCWDRNPHSWLGSASARARVGR